MWCRLIYFGTSPNFVNDRPLVRNTTLLAHVFAHFGPRRDVVLGEEPDRKRSQTVVRLRHATLIRLLIHRPDAVPILHTRAPRRWLEVAWLRHLCRGLFCEQPASIRRVPSNFGSDKFAPAVKFAIPTFDADEASGPAPALPRPDLVLLSMVLDISFPVQCRIGIRSVPVAAVGTWAPDRIHWS
jgi:hypothetical protein